MRYRDTDDGANTPALVTSFQGRPHYFNLNDGTSATRSCLAARFTHISGAIKCVVESSVGNIDEMVGDGLALRKVSRIDELHFVPSELLGPGFLVGIGVDCDDTGGPNHPSRVDDAEADAATAKDCDTGVCYNALLRALTQVLRLLTNTRAGHLCDSSLQHT